MSALVLFRPDGCQIGCFNGTTCVCPEGKTPTPAMDGGIPVYPAQGGGRGLLIVEARRGLNNQNVGTTLTPADASERPSLQVEVDQDLGNGSTDVCDIGAPPMGGGIPGIDPPSFGPGQAITDALTDFACRFEPPVATTKQQSRDRDLGCSLDATGNISFVSPVPGSTLIWQFCANLAEVTSFTTDQDTLVTVQVLDVHGVPGPTAQIKVRVPTPEP